MNSRVCLIFCMLLLILVAFTGVSGASQPANNSSNEQKLVRIAAFSLYPAIFKAKDNSIQGYYVDIIAEIAKREGWKVEYVFGSWADGLARIKTGEVDVLTSVTWTAERSAFMDFGKVPLLTAWSELYVNNKSSIDSIRQVQGKKIAVMKGDSNAANFRNLIDKFGIACQLVEYDTFEDILKAVSTNQVDGGVVNNTYGAAKQHDFKVKSSGVIFNPFDIYFTVAKGKNHNTLKTFDTYLSEWRVNENSPYHLSRQRWAHGSAGTIRSVPVWLNNVLIGLVIVFVIAAAFIVQLRRMVKKQTIALKREVETRKQAEEAMFQNEKMTMIAGMAAGIAHEVNNPLGIIAQDLQNLERRFSPTLHANRKVAEEIGLDLELVKTYMQRRNIHEFISSMRSAAKRASAIVANMLQFSRQSEAPHQLLDLKDIIDESIQLAANDYDLRKKYDFKNIAITRNYGEQLPKVSVCINEIEQVFINLLKNAAQAMFDAGTVKPSILLQTTYSCTHVIIMVKDNGPGMSDAVCKQVFDPFFTTKDIGAGTGLGLSVSYALITQNHGGEISVESSLEQGTCFTIRLPRSKE